MDIRELPRSKRRAARQTLKRVLEIFGPDGSGWGRLMLDNGEGRYCLIGAIRKADGEGENVALAAVEKAINSRTSPTYAYHKPIKFSWGKPYPIPVYNFNDNGKTTFLKVRKVVQKALKLLGTD